MKTRFFYGMDIWAEVGGTPDMDYGEGYCLPIGWDEEGPRARTAYHAIRPRHDVESSMRLLKLEPSRDEVYIEPHRFLELIAQGQPVFK
jgi:hypothetical protein